MITTNKYVISWILVIVAIIVILVTGMYSKKSPEYASTALARADSLSVIVAADGVTISRLNTQIDSMKVSAIVRSDSSSERKTASEKSVKIVIRTVYKDSIREVYVEKTEAMEEYQRTLTTLRDSISVLNVKLSKVSDRKDFSSVNEVARSESHEKIASVSKKLDSPGAVGITSGIRVHSDASVSKEIHGYVSRKLIGPMFVGADAYWETGESIQGTAGAGVIIGPFSGYLGAGYDGSPCVKASVSANFTF